MFARVIRGRVGHAEAAEDHFRRWMSDIAPGAPGWLNVTRGVTAARDDRSGTFASEQDARSDEVNEAQVAWWDEAGSLLADDLTFYETTDVTELSGGPTRDAGFVQMMLAAVADRPRSAAMSAISHAPTTLPPRRWVITAWSIPKLRPVPSTPATPKVPVTATRAISTSPSTTTWRTSWRSSGMAASASSTPPSPSRRSGRQAGGAWTITSRWTGRRRRRDPLRRRRPARITTVVGWDRPWQGVSRRPLA
jgi:hypothetical protein